LDGIGIKGSYEFKVGYRRDVVIFIGREIGGESMEIEEGIDNVDGGNPKFIVVDGDGKNEFK